MHPLAERALDWYFRQTYLERGKWTVGTKVVRRYVHDVTCTSKDGLRFAVDPVDLIQLSILVTGEWEPGESEAVRTHLAPGDVFYDIGANCGFFTLLASKLVGPTGHVYAFEPNPSILAKLRRNLELNGVDNVTTFPLGASDANAVHEFTVMRGTNSGMSSMRAIEGNETSQIEVVRIDDLIAERGLRPPDFVKMDIEGAEFRAVQGMRRALGGPDGATKLLIEISDQFLRDVGGDEASLLAALAEAGFAPVRQTSRHRQTLPNGQPFQYTSYFERTSPAPGGPT